MGNALARRGDIGLPGLKSHIGIPAISLAHMALGIHVRRFLPVIR
jgi:hypothetical protein